MNQNETSAQSSSFSVQGKQNLDNYFVSFLFLISFSLSICTFVLQLWFNWFLKVLGWETTWKLWLALLLLSKMFAVLYGTHSINQSFLISEQTKLIVLKLTLNCLLVNQLELELRTKRNCKSLKWPWPYFAANYLKLSNLGLVCEVNGVSSYPTLPWSAS